MRTITIVGASLAGLSTARALRTYSYQGRIVIVGAERHPPYDRPPLSKEFLAGAVSVEDVSLTTDKEEALDVDWRLGRTAVGLDPSGTAVLLDSGDRISSDGVVVATGARARQFPGGRLDGVHTLRTLDDAVALREELVPGARLVIIGAGFVGSEVAATARSLGVDVTLVEAAPVPLAGPLGAEMGKVCAALHGDHGVRLITGAGVGGLIGSNRVRAVRLADGVELPADVVVVGIGAVPCVDWLVGSGVHLDGGVVTDANCATTIPGVVAAGDCASSYNPYTQSILRLEHWTNAQRQPMTAAATLLGKAAAAPAGLTVPYFWSDQYGMRLQFAGHRVDGDRVEVIEGDTRSRRFVAVYRRDERPVAVLAMNQPKLFVRWRRALATAQPTAASATVALADGP